MANAKNYNFLIFSSNLYAIFPLNSFEKNRFWKVPQQFVVAFTVLRCVTQYNF
jgi:hypothetical protein